MGYSKNIGLWIDRDTRVLILSKYERGRLEQDCLYMCKYV